MLRENIFYKYYRRIMLDKLIHFLKKKPLPRVDCSHHRILKDPLLNQQLIQKGYIVLPFLNDNQIIYLKELYSKWHSDNQPTNFYKSYFSSDKQYLKEVENIIFEFFKPNLNEYLIDHDLFGGMFVVRPHGQEGNIPPHQDWSLLDETKHWSLNTWCPLDDTHSDFGIFKVLPGSHRFIQTIRGYGIPKHYGHLEDEIEKHFINLHMKAGEIVIFYHSLLHGSSMNLRQTPRVAVGCSVTPKNSQLLYQMIADNESKLRKYNVSKEFFSDYTYARGKLPDQQLLVDTEQIKFELISKKQLLEKIKQYNNPDLS